MCIIPGFFETYQAITTAFIGLIGIWFTMWLNNSWKSKEHTLNLKKDVYLAAAEAIHQAINSIANFSNLELSDLDIQTEFRKQSPNISKALLVAEKDLRIALQNFN